jgi:hypothetical protein
MHSSILFTRRNLSGEENLGENPVSSGENLGITARLPGKLSGTDGETDILSCLPLTSAEHSNYHALTQHVVVGLRQNTTTRLTDPPSGPKYLSSGSPHIIPTDNRSIIALFPLHVGYEVRRQDTGGGDPSILETGKDTSPQSPYFYDYY